MKKEYLNKLVCNKCGECCKQKGKIVGSDKTITLWTCPYLDENNLCKIYNSRDKWKPIWCHTIDELKMLDRIKFLPDNCIFKTGG